MKNLSFIIFSGLIGYHLGTKYGKGKQKVKAPIKREKMISEPTNFFSSSLPGVTKEIKFPEIPLKSTEETTKEVKRSVRSLKTLTTPQPISINKPTCKGGLTVG